MGVGVRRLVVLLAALALVAAACGDDDDDGGAAGGGGDGGTVTVFGAFVDAEAQRFEEVLAPFEEATGIDVVYEGTPNYTELVRVRAQADDLADIVVFPNPGLMAEFARDGHLEELTGEALDAFNENYSEDWRDLGTVDGTPYGMWMKAAVKSLVWYPVPEFEDAGYAVPTSWDELIALSDQIVADGGTPWCIGIEDAQATGWVGTDWVEDIMLRLHGPEVYDQWVNHEIPFDDPRVVEAMEELTNIWLNADYVRGGTASILTVPFGDSPRPMFDDPPGCYLHRQASFITSFFPDDVQASLETESPEVGVFQLPGTDGNGAPMLGAGDVAAMTNTNDATIQVMAHLGDPTAFESWAAAGGYFSPHEGFDATQYATPIERQAGEFLANASFFRFDASDLMPGEVGAGSFWTGIVDLAQGASPEEVASDIESSWPGG